MVQPNLGVKTSDSPVVFPAVERGGAARSSSAESVREKAHPIPTPQPSSGERARRIVNVLASMLLLIASAPLMLLIVFLVKATSPGPVLYTQPRVGIDRRYLERRDEPGSNGPPQDRRARGRRHTDSGGRVFTIYKFRTMTVDPSPTGQIWAAVDDPRITPIGRVLRKLRLDELPQLFNVLRGDMNLVGPRPEQPDIFAELRREIGDYPGRQRVLPGITGWAQVNHAYDQSLEDVRRKVDLDLEYIGRRSAVEDLKIMAKTVPVMVFKKGSL